MVVEPVFVVIMISPVWFLLIFAFPYLPVPFATFRHIIRRVYVSKSGVKMLSKVHSPKSSGFPF